VCKCRNRECRATSFVGDQGERWASGLSASQLKRLLLTTL